MQLYGDIINITAILQVANSNKIYCINYYIYTYIALLATAYTDPVYWICALSIAIDKFT